MNDQKMLLLLAAVRDTVRATVQEELRAHRERVAADVVAAAHAPAVAAGENGVQHGSTLPWVVLNAIDDMAPEGHTMPGLRRHLTQLAARALREKGQDAEAVAAMIRNGEDDE